MQENEACHELLLHGIPFSIKTKIVSLNCLLRRDFYDMTCQFSGGEYIDTDFHYRHPAQSSQRAVAVRATPSRAAAMPKRS